MQGCDPGCPQQLVEVTKSLGGALGVRRESRSCLRGEEFRAGVVEHLADWPEPEHGSVACCPRPSWTPLSSPVKPPCPSHWPSDQWKASCSRTASGGEEEGPSTTPAGAGDELFFQLCADSYGEGSVRPGGRPTTAWPGPELPEKPGSAAGDRGGCTGQCGPKDAPGCCEVGRVC